MSYSTFSYTANGTQTDFVVSVDYLDRDYISVKVDGVLTSDSSSSYTFSWVNDTTLRIVTILGSSPVSSGLEIEIIRVTPVDTPQVVFNGGTALTSSSLNKNNEYLIHSLQELKDTTDDLVILGNETAQAAASAAAAAEDAALAATLISSAGVNSVSHAEFVLAVAGGYDLDAAIVDGKVWVRDDSLTDGYLDEKTGLVVSNAGRGFWWVANAGNTIKYRPTDTTITSDMVGLTVANSGSPVDMTFAIESTWRSGLFNKFVFTDMYYFQYLFVPAGVEIDGGGVGTGLIQLPGIRYCEVGGANNGEFGLTGSASNLNVVVRNIEIDGNYLQCHDYTGADGQAGSWASTENTSGDFVVGRMKCNGIFANTNAAATLVQTWENIYSHDWARNCFLAQNGTVFYSNLHGKNSAVDHIVYSDTGTAWIGSGILVEGFAKNAMIVMSGISLTDVHFKDFTENPNTIPVFSLNLQTGFLVDMRTDRGNAGSLCDVTVEGDLNLINTVDTPELARVRSSACQLNRWRVIHTGAASGDVWGIHYTGSSGAAGGYEGGSAIDWAGLNLPDGYQLFVADGFEYGMGLNGFTMSTFNVTYNTSGSSRDLALIELNGVRVDGCTFQNITAMNNFGSDAVGPGRFFDNNVTGTGSEFMDNLFSGCQVRQSSSSYEPTNSTSTAETISGNRIVDCNFSSATPTGDNRTDYRYHRCVFWNGFSEVEDVVDIAVPASNTATFFEIDLNGDYKMDGQPRIAQVWVYETDAGAGDTIPAIDVIRPTTTTGGRGAIRVAFESAPPEGTLPLMFRASI